MDLPCCDTTITSLSEVPLSSDFALIFDLDDTLYAERDFVRSGFRAISGQFATNDQTSIFQQLETLFDCGDADPLGTILEQTNSSLKKEALLQVYREHQPELELASGVQKLFSQLTLAGHQLGILTDGRSITQRNKIKALGLGQWVTEVVISEEFGSCKPDPRNYQHFEKTFCGNSFAYIGDNLAKDFITPNQLGWVTIALLDRGKNIHQQRLKEIEPGYCPKFFVHELV